MKPSDTSYARLGELLRQLFALLEKHPEGLQRKEALARLRETIQLRPSEMQRYESTGARRFETRMGYATGLCVGACWLSKQRGCWTITPAGRAALKELRDPAQFFSRARRIHRASRARERKAEEPVSPSTAGSTPVDLPAGGGRAIEAARDTAWAEIERHMATMDPYGFQRLVADLLRAMGWHVPWEAPPGPDGGVDITAFRDPLGATGGRLKVQVKSGAMTVRCEPVRAFAAAINEEEAGIMIATGGFTGEADTFARYQARKRLTLVDLPRLVELWARHYPRLDAEARQRLPLAPVWFLTAS